MQAPTPHPGSIQPGATSIRRQHGSMAIAMMLMLLGLISILGIVEVGYLYWAHRDAQKVADLAALSGAQQLSACTTGNNDNTAARSNATTDNHFKGSLDIACGYWAPSITGDQHFTATVDASHPRNAVRVKVSMPLTPFFGFAHFSGVETTAIAANRGDPIAAFSVGSRLLDLSDTGPLNQLLNSVIGTSLGLKLLSYDGIADGNVSLLGLKDALHIDAGTVTGVLGTQVSLGDFLDTAVDVLQQNGSLANVDVTSAKTQIANIPVDLRNVEIELGDILNVQANTEDPGKALDVNVNAQDLLSAAIQAADSKHAVALEVPNLDLLGLANVNLKLAIVEPPKIGVGRAGYNSDGTPITIAHTAQVRLSLDLSVLKSAGDGKTLLNLLLVTVSLPNNNALTDIPLNIELVPAEAWLDTLQCHVPDGASGKLENLATLKARPGAANAFLGNLPDSTYGNEHQRWEDIVDAAIADGSAYAHLLDIQVDILGSVLTPPVRVKLKAYANAPIVRSAPPPHTFHVDPGIPVSQQPDMSWSTDTGQDLLASALAAAFSSNLLHVQLETDGLGFIGSIVDELVNNISPILTGTLGLLAPVLQPVLAGLDQALVGPLLKLLGVDIGAADIRLLDVNCDTGVQLVY